MNRTFLRRTAIMGAAATALLAPAIFAASAQASPATASVTLGAAHGATPAARTSTTLSISKTGVLAGTTNKHNVTCVLKNASTGAGINGAIVQLDRNGQLDHTGTTSDGGVVTFTVTVDKGTSATFQCIFPGNGSFLSSTSGTITVSTS